MPKLLIFDAFTLLIREKTVANYALLQCKTFSLKIWVCKIFDKFHVCTRSGTSGTTSSSTSPGGSAEKKMASATMVQLLNKLLHPAPRLKYYSSNLMVCENRNVKSIL